MGIEDVDALAAKEIAQTAGGIAVAGRFSHDGLPSDWAVLIAKDLSRLWKPLPLPPLEIKDANERYLRCWADVPHERRRACCGQGGVFFTKHLCFNDEYPHDECCLLFFLSEG